jgi:hypothetical protein
LTQETKRPEEFITINISQETVDILKFYRNIVSPLIESYWLSAKHLFRLLPKPMEYEAFTSSLSDSAKDQLRQGLLCFRELNLNSFLVLRPFTPTSCDLFKFADDASSLFSVRFLFCQLNSTEESIASEPLKNSVTLFENSKVLERKSVSGVTVIYLTDEFHQESSLKTVIKNIERFKK